MGDRIVLNLSKEQAGELIGFLQQANDGNVATTGELIQKIIKRIQKTMDKKQDVKSE